MATQVLLLAVGGIDVVEHEHIVEGQNGAGLLQVASHQELVVMGVRDVQAKAFTELFAMAEILDPQEQYTDGQKTGTALQLDWHHSEATAVE